MTHPPNNPSFNPEPGTLVIEDRSLAYGFIQLPKQILWASNLSRDAKILYAVLLGYAWEQDSCFPGYARLCGDMGASENMVRKYMRELEAVGLLSQRRRGLGKTNIYLLHDLRTSKIEVQEPHKSKTSKIEVQEPQKVRGNNKQREQETENNISNIRMAYPSINRGDEERPPREGPAFRPPSAGFEGMDTLLQRRRGRPSAAEREARQVIEDYIRDFAREFNDQALLKSSVTRAINLMQDAGVTVEAFIGALYEARSITKERTAAIRTVAANGKGGMSPKNKMGYYFAVVEDLLGLKEETADSNNQSLAD